MRIPECGVCDQYLRLVQHPLGKAARAKRLETLPGAFRLGQIRMLRNPGGDNGVRTGALGDGGITVQGGFCDETE